MKRENIDTLPSNFSQLTLIDPNRARPFWKKLTSQAGLVFAYEHVTAGHPPDVAAISQLLSDYAEASNQLGEPVTLSPEITHLISEIISGTRPKRRGPRTSLRAYYRQKNAIICFNDLREDGHSFDSALNVTSERLDMSPETLRDWIRPYLTVAKRKHSPQ